MNTELIHAVANAIEAEAGARFDMRHWGALVDGPVQFKETLHGLERVRLEEDPDPDLCKMAYCAAGWAMVESGYEPVFSYDWEDDATSINGRYQRRWIRTLKAWFKEEEGEEVAEYETSTFARVALGWAQLPVMREGDDCETDLFHDFNVKPEVMVAVLRAIADGEMHPRIIEYPDGTYWTEHPKCTPKFRDVYEGYCPEDDEIEYISFNDAIVILEGAS